MSGIAVVGPFNRFGAVTAPRDVSLAVAEGECVAPVGPSGRAAAGTASERAEASLPSAVDRAIPGPVILPRTGSDASVFLRLDACSRSWARVPRPLAIDARSGPDS